jgi:hypothetical protein
MPGQNPTFQTGPRTYEVEGNVKGGDVVEHSTVASTSGVPVVKTSGAGSARVMGVAFKDAVSVANRAALEQGTTAYPGGFVTNDISVPDEFTAVYNDCWVKVAYASAVAERAPIKSAASGGVALFVEGTDDPKLRIGWCAQLGGVAAAGVGLARILV